MTAKQAMLIGGKWIDADDTFEVRSPYTGEVLAAAARAGENEIERSLASAAVAAAEMQRLARFEVASGLRKIADGIRSRFDDFARSITDESAKPIVYARGEVERAISTFSWASGEAERFTGEIVPIDIQGTSRGKWARTILEPRGVIYGITPFNFPLNLVAHKVAPALASGNAIIIKPSERTPLTALLLGEVFLESGLPASALQIVPADVKHVGSIISDPRVAMLSFTGSAPIGWDLKTKIGKKPIALELGGNAPVIIDRSADRELSLTKTIGGSFAYSGQVCIGVQRVFVHSDIYETWISEFIARSQALKRGDPRDDGTEISVMIDEAAASRVGQWINDATAQDAKVLSGGVRDGGFFEPTIVADADPRLKIVSEEVFGPVAVVERFDDVARAIDRANDSKYGLQAAIFSNDQDAIELAARGLKFGGVIVNDSPSFRVDNMPYGGVKESGFGREGVRYAMDEMTEKKIVVYDS